jgi:membrane protease subunit HflC
MKYWIGGVVGVIVVAAIASSAFIVPEGRQAAQLTSSKQNPVWLSAGLHFRWPLGHSVVWRDQRQHVLAATGTASEPYVAVTTFDQKSLELGYIALWNVTDFSLFTAEKPTPSQIRGMINQALSQSSLSQTLAQWLDQSALTAIMLQAVTAANAQLQARGIKLSQLQLTALVVPAIDRNLWLDGMKSRGQNSLNQLQLQTSTLAANLKANVDNKVTQTLSTAKSQAADLHLKADAQATAVYTDAYNKNPGFYEFYTSLQTYQQAFKTRPPVLVLNTDSPFLQAMNGN